MELSFSVHRDLLSSKDKALNVDEFVSLLLYSPFLLVGTNLLFPSSH